jgi:dTDP-4-amino-4,6-dideoxygalactose transaminase
MSVPDTVRHGSREVIFESYPEVGFNYRMTDVQAAIGRVQLAKLPAVVEERRRLALAYRELLSDIPGLRPPVEPDWARSNWQSYCVRLPEGIAQRAVMQHLLDAGVSARRGVMCAHLEAAYGGEPVSTLGVSERAQDGCVILPLFSGMDDSDLGRIGSALERACATLDRA